MIKLRQLFILLSICSLNLFHAQLIPFAKNYLNKFINDTTPIEKPQFLLYPTLAYAPETSWEFGVNSIFVGYAKNDTNNRLSEVTAFTFITANSQFGFYLDHALYANQNNWFMLGKLKAQSFPLSYYGIGHDTEKEKIATVDAFNFTIKERFLRKIKHNLYAGIEFDWQHLSNVEFIEHQENSTTEKPHGHAGSSNIGIGVGLIYDDRHNVLNVRKGALGEIAWINYRAELGSISNFHSFFIDSRYYIPVRKKNVLAFQTIGQFNNGTIPFNQLALVGGEMMMRGFYYGRFRDRNYLSSQVEYRMLPVSFAKKFGFAIFGSVGTIYNQFSEITLENLKSSGGVGVHYLLFPKKDVWTRLDFALNNEGGTGIYFFMGCAF